MSTTDFTSITEAQWLSLDNTAIGLLLGVNPATVARHRKRLEIPRVRKPGAGRKATVSLTRFRLDETDKQNAERLGITRQRAWQMRQQLKQEGDEWV